MPGLPNLSPNDVWGGQLDGFLLVAHNANGTLKAFISVTDLGIFGDGVTDVTTGLQNCFDAAVPGSLIVLPPGVYIVSASLLYSGNCKIIGAGDSDNGTIIRVKAGTALTTPVLASKDWYNNSATCGNPVHISDLQIDGNSATSGASAHGLVAMNFWSSFDRISINNVSGDGFLFSAQSRNGTHISNTCVEAKIGRIQVRTTGGDGIHIKDNGSGLNSCTDGFLKDCIVTGAGARGVNVEMGPGWYVDGTHIYGTVAEGLYVSRCYATRVRNTYIDGYGSGSSTYIAGIGMEILDGRGSSCIGNHVGFESGTATGPYQGIAITGKGSGISVCEVGENTVIGGSQSGSIAYVFQAQGSQVGHPFYVYAHDNDSQGVATRLYQDANTSGGNLVVLGHIGCENQNLPTAAAGTNAGTGPPAPVRTNCSDLSGKITFGTGTAPSAGAQAVITFNVAYLTAPSVIISSINDVTAILTLSVTSTTTTFTISCHTAPAASQANTTYGFFYHVFM